MPYGATNYYEVPVVKDGQLTVHDTHASDLFTDNALEFLDRQADVDRPFCLDVHYTAPHAPWGREHHPAARWDDYREHCPFESVPGPDEPRPLGYQAPRVDAERRKDNLAGYFAAIEGMDRNVGRLLDWLDERHLRGNIRTWTAAGSRSRGAASAIWRPAGSPSPTGFPGWSRRSPKGSPGAVPPRPLW